MIRACLFMLVALTLVSSASAQPKQADELFARGVEAMKAQDWATACPAIAESYQLDPQPGALFTLAECRARAGKVASAEQDFARYLELVAALPDEQRKQQEERIPVAERRRKELETRVPRLTIELPTDLPSDALVELDGAALTRQQLGVPMALDPGPHRVLVRVGTRESDTLITLDEREQRRLRLALPGELPPAPATPPPLPPPPTTTPIPEPSQDPMADESAPPGLRVAGWSSLALGTVGLVVAGTAGLLLIDKKDTIDANCSGITCNDAGLAAAEDIPTLDTLGTVAFAAGGVATAAGIAMLIATKLQW